MKSGMWLMTVYVAAAAGCSLTPQERIDRAEQALTVVQEVSTSLDARIAALQAGIAQIQATLTDPNLAGETATELQATVAKGGETLAKLQEQKVKVDKVIASVKAVIAAGPDANADISDELRLVGQSLLAASNAVPGEIGLWLKIVGGLVVTLSTLVAGWSATKLSTVKTALAEVVAGGEIFKSKVTDTGSGATAAATIEVFRSAQAKAQKHETTRLMVEQTQRDLAA